MRKLIIGSALAISFATTAIATVPGSTKVVVIAAESVVSTVLDSIVETQEVTAQTDDVFVSEVRIPGTLDTAAWSAWTEGVEEGGVSSTETVSGTPVVTQSGGEVETYEVQEGDFMVTYQYTTAVIETTTTPQTKVTTTTAVTRTDTRTCDITINGVEDEVAPTCDPNEE